MDLLRLRVRPEDMRLAGDERQGGVRLVAWTSAYRKDAGPESEVDIAPIDLPEKIDVPGKEVVIGIPLPTGYGTVRAPGHLDDNVWFGAHIFAPSEEGVPGEHNPLVGSRGGCGAVSMRDLKARLMHTEAKDFTINLYMSQPGAEGKGPYRKMTLRVLDFASDADRRRAQQMAFDERAGKYAFVPPNKGLHEGLLNEYVNIAFFPYTNMASKQGVYFPPSHEAVAPIHAPTYLNNVPTPGFQFWMMNGIPSYDEAMHAFFDEVAQAVLRRHDMSEATFVDVASHQLALTEDTYDDRFTMICAVMADMCNLLAVSTFYRFDEEWQVEPRWFREPKETKYQVESFHDALAMAGGDCEDQGALINRVFTWLQLGDPANRSDTDHWKKFGGWRTRVLDIMQRIAYWYVGCGSLGSVTAARVKGKAGKSPRLFIESDEDERKPVGGHMWFEMVIVSKLEALLIRMNPSGAKEGMLRPGIAYPKWLHHMPHLVGEGTGWLHPLVLPWEAYMFDAQAKEAAVTAQSATIDAIEFLNKNTKVLSALQIQRVSDRTRLEADRRVNTFYRRTTTLFFGGGGPSLYADMPYFEATWTLMSPRIHEASQRGGLQNFPVANLPGESDPHIKPTYGVDMRDKILAENNSAPVDKANVALTIAPPATREQLESFRSRRRQLRPWRQPRRRRDVEANVRAKFDEAIRPFQARVDKLALGAARSAPLDQASVSIIFRRRHFLNQTVAQAALEDLEHIADRLAKVDVFFEFFDEDIYNVHLRLHINVAAGSGKDEA